MRIKPTLPLLVVTALLASVLLPPPARTQPRVPGAAQTPPSDAGRYYALVIGNDDYTSLPKLKTAVADAREVERVLRESYGFQTRLLLNATRAQIIASLSAYRRELGADANLVIYYAGHGYNDKEAGKAYWLPVDASKDDTSNWIIADEITTGIRVIPARKVLVISDSCYSGTLTRGLSLSSPPPAEREQFLQRMAAGRSRTLMASGGDEPVVDGGGGGHSVFAGALLRGLRQIDKPQFTAAELFSNYVIEPVAGRAEQTPVYDPLRNSGHESGDFVFVKVKTDGKTVEVTVSAPPAAKVDPAQQELTFWTTIQNSADAEDFKDYLARYPNGLYSGIARRKLAALSAAAKPAPTPAPVSTSNNTATAVQPNTNAPSNERAERPAPSTPPVAKPEQAGTYVIIAMAINDLSQTIHRRLTPYNYIEERTLNTAGVVVNQRNICHVLDLPVISETADSNNARQTIRRVRDTTGAIIEITLDPSGKVISTHVISRATDMMAILNTPTPNTPNTVRPSARPTPGTVVRARSGIELVYVPPGEFLMGSENGERHEKPVHRVTIREGFWMGKYEVTQAQWQAVMGNNPSAHKGCVNCPVEQVSWDDAREFIRKLNEQDGAFIYRLPTEAEWEYACRAGTAGDYSGPADVMGWYRENADDKSHPVGQKNANGFGLHDMQGNVWEWCEDVWHDDYNGAPTDGSAWVSDVRPEDSRRRVVRGGSYLYHKRALRSASRGTEELTYRIWTGGFRVVAVARQ